MIVYLHRRKSDSEVFYVGIGSKKRAYSIFSRNKHWKDYVSKHPYYVDITHENIIREEACVIEKYLIEFYKKNSKLNLTNKTNGGDGADREQSLLLNKKRWSNPKQKEDLILRNKIRWSNPIEKEKLANRNKIRFSNIDERIKVSKANEKRFSNVEARINLKDKMKLFWSNLTQDEREKWISKMKKPKKPKKYE